MKNVKIDNETIENKIDLMASVSNIQKLEDGSFIVDKEGMPYHVINEGEYIELYNAIVSYLETHPEECREYEPEILSKEEKANMIRDNRDYLLNKADVIITKYQEQVKLGLVAENEKYYMALLQYKQDLRDITNQGAFPNKVLYPTLPKYEDYE